MEVPQLPGSPHLVTLAYLLGLLAVAALVWWIVAQVRASKEAQ
jgi:hypothetical protein